MVLTYSEDKLKFGDQAPEFELVEPLTGKKRNLNELKGEKGAVVVFMCNHCPYVVHILNKLLEVARQYIPEGIAFVGISANDPEKYPEDSPEAMAQLASKLDFPFPYLFDETQEVAKEYGALCTPEFFVFDKDLKLVYHGRFDESSPGRDAPVTGSDLKCVLDALLGKGTLPHPEEWKPAMGCNIKWRD